MKEPLGGEGEKKMEIKYAYGFMFYFIPRWVFFSPFPHDITLLLVTHEYLALQGDPY
jgi:hypothetical protein